jgi:excisionase family DNA binding protein
MTLSQENHSPKRDYDMIFHNLVEGCRAWRYRHVAQFMDVSMRHVKRLVKADRIPYSKVGTSVRFCPWKIREWLEKGGSR